MLASDFNLLPQPTTATHNDVWNNRFIIVQRLLHQKFLLLALFGRQQKRIDTHCPILLKIVNSQRKGTWPSQLSTYQFRKLNLES